MLLLCLSDFKMHPGLRPTIYSRGPGNISRTAYYLRSLDPASSSRDDERKNMHRQGRAGYNPALLYAAFLFVIIIIGFLLPFKHLADFKILYTIHLHITKMWILRKSSRIKACR